MAPKASASLKASRSVRRKYTPEENDPVVAPLPEAPGSSGPVWVVLILQHHVGHLEEGETLLSKAFIRRGCTRVRSVHSSTRGILVFRTSFLPISSHRTAAVCGSESDLSEFRLPFPRKQTVNRLIRLSDEPSVK